jgi:hypothetical protein
VQVAKSGVEALPDNLPVADDDRADQRIGAYLAPTTLGERERPMQEFRIA